MSNEERIDLGSLLHKLRHQIRDRMLEMKDKYPLLVDYFDSELKYLEKQYDDVHKNSPVTPESEATLYFNYRRVNSNLSKIEHEGFSYLWDENLYKLMKKAADCNLGISSHWVKVLIASNLLELSLNQALQNRKPELFEKLRKEHANIVRKSEEVNKILGKNKLKRSDVHLINSHRIDVDHPIAEFISDLGPDDAKELINKVDECLTRLQPLFQNTKNSEYDEEDYLSGKYKTGNASKKTRELYFKIKKRILENFKDLEIRQTKAYIGFYFKDTTRCVCTLDVLKSKVNLAYAITTAKKVLFPSDFIRDVENVGIFGVGHYQSVIKNEDDIAKVLPFIRKVYDFKIEN